MKKTGILYACLCILFVFGSCSSNENPAMDSSISESSVKQSTGEENSSIEGSVSNEDEQTSSESAEENSSGGFFGGFTSVGDSSDGVLDMPSVDNE